MRADACTPPWSSRPTVQVARCSEFVADNRVTPRQCGTLGMPHLPPHFPPLWRESRASALEAGRAAPQLGVRAARGVPGGEGRPVLLIPGFLAGDGSLGDDDPAGCAQNGYRTRRAGIRANVGCSEEACARLEARLEGFAERHGRARRRSSARAAAASSPARWPSRRPGPRRGHRHARLADRLPAQHPPARARPGRRRRARSAPAASRACSALSCLRGDCCERVPRRDRAARSPATSATSRCTRAPTASSTGTPAWTRRPSRSRSAPRTAGWRVNAQVYREVGYALGAFGAADADWAQAA